MILLLDSNDLQNAVQVMNGEGKVAWAEGPLDVQHIMRQDCTGVFPAEAIKPNKVANTSIAFGVKMFLCQHDNGPAELYRGIVSEILV